MPIASVHQMSSCHVMLKLLLHCCSTTDTLGSYRGLNQSEIVKGEPPPLIGRGPDIPVRVCTFEDACAAAVRQREIEVSSRDARSFFSESALFSEHLTVPPGFCDC